MSKNLSAIKRSYISLRNRKRNRIYKSLIKTFTKKFLLQCQQNNQNGVNSVDLLYSLGLVYQKIDKAVKRGVLHKNKGARQKARLAKYMQNYSF